MIPRKAPVDAVPDEVIPSGWIAVPGKTRLRDGQIDWDFKPGNLVSIRKPTVGLIADFIRLKAAPDEAIHTFLKYWGPLRINPVGLELQDQFSGTDHCDDWRFLAARAAAVLHLATDLRDSKPGRKLHWDHLSTVHGRFDRARFLGLPDWALKEPKVNESGVDYVEMTIAGARAVIAGELSAWMKQFPVSLEMGWSRVGGWSFEVHYGGRLTSALAFQLANKVAGGGLYRCSNLKCGKLYNRKARRPRKDQGNYCPECARKGAGIEKADERRRKNMQEARFLHARGVSNEEIRRRLGVRKVATIVRWLGKQKEDR